MFYPTNVFGKLFRYYHKMPDHPVKKRIQNLIGRYCFRPGIQFQNEEGLRFILPANDWITRHFIGTGSYEPLSLKLAKRLLGSDGVFLDIGSNFGLYSCSVAYKNNVRSIAIDPNYKIIHSLVAHINLNNLADRVKIVNAAISPQFQLVSIEETNPSNLGSTSVDLTGVGNLSVLSCPLEYILEKNNWHEVDLVKIDIEGNEFDTLQQFDFDKYFIKNIILEFRPESRTSLSQLKAFFDLKGFKSFNVNGEGLVSSHNIPEDNIWLSNTKASS